MWSYFSCARQFLKCNAKNAFFTGIKASFTSLAGICWERINPAEVSSDGNWIFSQSRTMSLRRSDLMAIVMGRLKNKEHNWLPIIWERDASREDLKGFHEPLPKRFQYCVNLYSALIELKKSASRWTRTRRKILPIEWRKMSTLEKKRIGGSLFNKSGKIGPVRDLSDFNETLTQLHRLHQESGEERLAPILYWQYQKWASVVFIQHILVAVERFLVELMTINKKVRNWAHVKSSKENGETRCAVSSHNPQTCRLARFFCLLQLGRLQLTVVCCDRRRVSTPHFTSHFLTFSHWLTLTCVVQVGSLSCAHHVSWAISMRSCCVFDSFRLLHFPLFPVHLLSYHPVFPSCPSTSSSTMWWTNSPCILANEDIGTLAEYEPLTGYEPSDNHISEATELYIQESSVETGSPNDLEYDDVTPSARRSLHHCSPRSEKMMRAVDEPVTLKKVCRPVSRRRPSVMIERGDPCVCTCDSQVSSVQETQERHSSESEQIRILLERQKEQTLADCQAETRKHEFQADNDRRSIQKLNEMIESQKEETRRAHQGDERLRRYLQLLHEQLLKQNWDLREAHDESLCELEELKRFQGSTLDTIARRKLVEDRDTILDLTGKIQELQNEIDCWMIREIFKMLNQYAVDNPTLPVKQCFSYLF